MTNTNCLANIKCPACGNEDKFRIAAHTIATVTDDGTEDYGDIEWDDGSYAECTECLKAGKLRDFQVDVDAQGNCRHCGREYDDLALTACPSDDCPGYHARAEGCDASEETEANAAIMTAAPELLEALEATVEYLTMQWANDPENEPHFLEPARLTIAKATAA